MVSTSYELRFGIYHKKVEGMLCFAYALLIWSTNTSYDHKRDFKTSKSNILVRILLGVAFSNAHSFGPSLTHEF